MTETDPKLSRLYREASREAPPAALDAAILAAARERIAKPERRKRSSWLNWMAPASAIATLVLGVSIALLVEREQPATTPGKILEQTAPSPAAPPAASETESAKAKAADSAAPAAATKKQAPATAAPAHAPAPAAQTPAPAPAAPMQAPARAAEPGPPAAEAFPAERRAGPAERGMAAPDAAESKSSRELNAAGDAAPGAAASGAPAAPAGAGKVAPLRQQAIRRSPEAWLEEISRLRRDGREQEAARQLAEFRKAYPAHSVPESLRSLE